MTIISRQAFMGQRTLRLATEQAVGGTTWSVRGIVGDGLESAPTMADLGTVTAYLFEQSATIGVQSVKVGVGPDESPLTDTRWVGLAPLETADHPTQSLIQANRVLVSVTVTTLQFRIESVVERIGYLHILVEVI